jgi:hypothetical protein
VVVDLQECYESEFLQQKNQFKKMLETIEEKVALTKERKEPVVSIICPPDGPPIPGLDKILGRVPTIYKDGYDGSTEIDGYIKRKNLSPNLVELCGVFANVCVLSTWIGLKKLGYNLRPVDPRAVLFVPTSKTRVASYPEGYLDTDKVRRVNSENRGPNSV